MTSVKYIGLDVHKESISICVRNSVGKVVMKSVIETKASTILQFIDGLRGDLRVTFEEGTWAAWLYDLLKPHVTKIVVCNPRRNALLKEGNKSDRIDARKLAELLRGNQLKPVYHGEHMHGDDDQIVPIANAALKSVKILKRPTLKVYPGFPHGMFTIHPEQINGRLSCSPARASA